MSNRHVTRLHAGSNPVRNRHVTLPPTRPDPTRPAYLYRGLILLKRCRLRRFAPQLPTKPLPNKRSGQELTQACFPTTDRTGAR